MVTPAIRTAAAIMLLAQASQPQPPTIRSRTTLVPVDVRVVDAGGHPITDLKKEDFVVEENGVKQDVRLFQTHALTAEAPPAPGGSGLVPANRPAAPGGGPASANRRVFLLALGRGRLQVPAKAVDAVIKFVQDRLLPQDVVAVMAWNRSTDFTTDRASTLAVLERFKNSHTQVEADLVQYFSSLRALYGSGEIPADIQKDIDAVFAPAASQRLATGRMTDAKRMNSDARRAAEALQQAEINAARIPGTGPDTTFDTSAAELVGMSFDEFAETNLRSTQQVSALYSALVYLRHFEGEKHLVFVNEAGLFLPRLEDDKSLAALASDARVAIDTIHTGGTMTMNPMIRDCAACPLRLSPDRLARVSPSQFQQEQTVRNIAELSGGISTTVGSPDDLLARIDRGTRFEYLLGYLPANPALDGKYRRITVKVNRKGARVLYRHGYYARETFTLTDRKDFLAYTRIAGAGDLIQSIEDLKTTATAAYEKAARVVTLSVTVRIDKVKFTDADGRHKAALHTAAFCGDDRQTIVGEDWGTVDLNLSDATYRRFLAEGLTYTKRITVKAEPKFAKVIVYDSGSDSTGSVTVTLSSKP